MDVTKAQHHLKHLEKVHRELDSEIIKEERHYGNDALVTSMKKKKLQLKIEIENLKRQIEDETLYSR